MKIGIVTVDFPSVSETFIYVKAQQLAQRGHTVIIFCNNLHKLLFKKYFSDIINVQVVTFSRKNIILYILSSPFAMLNALIQKADFKKAVFTNAVAWQIKSHNPDVLHIEFSGLGVNYIDIIKKGLFKTVVSCRGSAEKVKLLVSEERKENMSQLLGAVDAIHCVSADMRKTILPYCSNTAKIFINYPSIDTLFFTNKTPRLASNIIQILSIGRFTFQKGYLTGLLAIKQLQGSFKNFKWVIVGAGPQHDEIIFHIHQLQLQDYVILAGTKTRNEVLELYANADIFFLPSVYEGIANAALEAMSMQLPVVATKSGGMEEVITHTENGFLANVYDATALAQHLLVLARDEAERKSTGVKARQRILEMFTIEKQTTIFEAVYQTLIKN